MMTGADYLTAIADLGMSQAAAGRLFATDRASRRWAKDGPPLTVAIILRLMKAVPLSPADIERIKAEVAA